MCEYVKDGQCSINNTQCPYTYLCHKDLTWKAMASMPANCRVKFDIKQDIPKGADRVLFERRGWLYVEHGSETVLVKNIFDEIPQFVKLSKTKEGWKARK